MLEEGGTGDGGTGMSKTRRAMTIAAVAAAGLFLTGAGGAQAAGQPTGKPVPGGPVPARAVKKLTAEANDLVKHEGNVRPTWAKAVVTTHRQALRSCTPGDTEPGNPTVYLVAMKGHFIDYDAPRPPGTPPPKGTYVCFDVLARSFRFLDYGIGHKPPAIPLAKLGPVTHLKVTAGHKP
jgi:hypothetical protein